MSTIAEVVHLHFQNPGTPPPEALIAALEQRENDIADFLRLTGTQNFGLYPAIIAEVLTQAGLGTPPSEEERAFIRQQFVNLMEELRTQGPGQPGPTN